MIDKIKRKLSKDQHTSELIKGSSIAFILRILGLFSAYIYTFLLAKWYGPNIVGTFSLVYIIIQIVAIIGKAGSDTATLKFSASFSALNQWDYIKNTLQKAYILVIPITLALSLLVFECSSFISVTIFHKPHLNMFVKYCSVCIVPFSLLYVNYEFLRGIKKIVQYSILQSILPFLLSAILIVVLKAFNYNDSQYAVDVFFVSIVVTFLVSLLYIRKFTKGKINWNNLFLKISSDPTWKVFTSVAFPLMIVNTISYMMGWIDTIVLGVYSSENTIGIYNLCLRIAMLTSLPLTAINTMISPQFASLWAKKDIASLKTIAQNSTKIIFAISLPIILILIIFPSFILGIFGKGFLPGATALIIISIAQFVNASCGSVGFLLQMTNHHVIFQKIILVATFINIILSYILIPKFGLVGAAISTGVTLIFWNITSLIVVKRKLGFWIIKLN